MCLKRDQSRYSVVSTKEILAGELDKQFLVSLDEIVGFWYPGDYMSEYCDCVGWMHECVRRHLQWEEIISTAREDERYPQIYNAIKQNGFQVPITAYVTQKKEIVLVDGHHRVGVA